MANDALVSVIISTYNRRQEVQTAVRSVLAQKCSPLELIVVDDCSSDGTSDEDFVPMRRNGAAPIKYVRLEANRGCGGARNAGIAAAVGEILLIIDDDAELVGSDAIANVVERLGREPGIGLLAFKSVDARGAVISEDFPYKNKQSDPASERPATYFTGVGFAIRREVCKRASGMAEDFRHTAWEVDWSFRILDAGYEILYFPAVSVIHRRSPRGRAVEERVWRETIRARIVTSVRCLPWRHVLISTIAYTALTLLRTRGNLRVVLDAFRDLIRERRAVLSQRRLLKPRTLARLRELDGRLYY